MYCTSLIEPRNADAVTPRFGLPFETRQGISTGISARGRDLEEFAACLGCRVIDVASISAAAQTREAEA